MSTRIVDIQLFPTGLAIKWDDESDSLLDYKKLRTLCPCAYCSGETDVFGNVYKGPNQSLSADAFRIINIVKVGHYAIRISWGDNHSTGIYSYEMLKKIEFYN